VRGISALEGARLQEAFEWVVEFRRFWDESFERIDEYLAELQKEKKSNGNQGRNRDGEN